MAGIASSSDRICSRRLMRTFRLKTKDQPPQEVSGKYVVVWQKVGGEWKLATDI